MIIENQASMSGEAASDNMWANIPERDIAALHVAMRSIKNEGKEGLEYFETDTSEEKIIVKLRHWNVIYQQDGDELKFYDLQHLTRARR